MARLTPSTPSSIQWRALLCTLDSLCTPGMEPTIEERDLLVQLLRLLLEHQTVGQSDEQR